ncbi:hypothetical protein MCOR27_010600 [Pyricularia oryzae]|nr:hypothetical protein MCOR02_007558 [Pyricularia oryzae]KAI6252105.1 hypothetical protein MCOR19_011277 [Pyricularia oryzae]KAI6267405.1 hypothetical protein MCOR27_010600 [Pyricularia oryzae]KAI6310782.1 hypothetical protein MCOR30_011026 [Pyricularia oryzae]KAI6314893.1 hypothetical protein MCOR34_004838 [Pyricularia oryzae]
MAEPGAPLNLDPAFLAENRAEVLQRIAISLAVITTAMMALRFYAKVRFQSPGIELFDIFLIAAYIITLGMCALGITMTIVGGVGQHVALFQQPGGDKTKLRGWAQCILAFEIIYFTSVALPKIAIIFMYIQVFNWRNTRRRVAWALVAINASLAISLVGAACFQCIPLAYWWDRSIPGGRCFDIQAFFHAQSVPGFILDLFIMALPLQSIWELKLPLIKKIALALIFLIASFGIVASVVRARIFFSTSAFEDRTWASVELVGWSIIESGTYVVTACLPHMKPIFSHYTPQAVKDFGRGAFSKASSALSGSKSFSTSSSGKRSRRRGDMDIHKSGDDIDHVEPVRLASLDVSRPPRHPAINGGGGSYDDDDDRNPFWAAEPRGPHDSIYSPGHARGYHLPRQMQIQAGQEGGSSAAAGQRGSRSASVPGPKDVLVTTKVTVTTNYDSSRFRSEPRPSSPWPSRI